VNAAPYNDPNGELMRRIAEISLLKERLEHTVDSLVARHGEQSDSVAPAKALAASVTALKRELLQQYLECCIAEAERATNSSSN
jgi:DNA-binding FrmR family transcriptional regulator